MIRMFVLVQMAFLIRPYGIDSTFDTCLTHGSGNDGMEVEPKCASCNDGYELNGDATACDLIT